MFLLSNVEFLLDYIPETINKDGVEYQFIMTHKFCCFQNNKAQHDYIRADNTECLAQSIIGMVNWCEEKGFLNKELDIDNLK